MSLNRFGCLNFILKIYFLEAGEGGTEIILKLRLSSNCQDVKLPLLTTDTIGMAKKKLQVNEIKMITNFLLYRIYFWLIIWFCFYFYTYRENLCDGCVLELILFGVPLSPKKSSPPLKDRKCVAYH